MTNRAEYVFEGESERARVAFSLLSPHPSATRVRPDWKGSDGGQERRWTSGGRTQALEWSRTLDGGATLGVFMDGDDLALLTAAARRLTDGARQLG